MTKLEELYIAKGQAHTQIEIGQQMLKEANQALSAELEKQNGEIKTNGVEEDTRDPKKPEQKSNRKSS